MGRTTAVAEWSEEDAGFVVELEAADLIDALHDEEAEGGQMVVPVSLAQMDTLQRAG